MEIQNPETQREKKKKKITSMLSVPVTIDEDEEDATIDCNREVDLVLSWIPEERREEYDDDDGHNGEYLAPTNLENRSTVSNLAQVDVIVDWVRSDGD